MKCANWLAVDRVVHWCRMREMASAPPSSCPICTPSAPTDKARSLSSLTMNVVPVSWVTLERHGEQVSAKAKVCLFFVVPYRNLTATGVTEVGTRISFPNTSNTTPRKGSPPDDEHFLIFRGDNGQSIEFPVADSSQDSLREKSAAFLQDPQATRLKFFAVSSWPLCIVGGFLSLLTLVYFLNAAVPLIHAVQRRCGVPPEKLFCAVSPEPTSTNSAPKPQG